MWLKNSVILFTAFLVWGCRSGPEPLPAPEEGGDSDISVAYLKSLYVNSPVQIDKEVYITGHVVSSDQYGCFYKTIYVQDDTGGIPVLIDKTNYYRTYFIGSCVRIACNSLVLGSYGGALRLGAYQSGEGGISAGYIPQSRFASTIVTQTDMDISPTALRLGISDLSPAHIGRHVGFEQVQFIDSDCRSTWCDPEDEYGTDRHLIDKNGNTLIVRTTPYASFANYLVPEGSGYIEGILTYFNGAYQLELLCWFYAMMSDPRF